MSSLSKDLSGAEAPQRLGLHHLPEPPGLLSLSLSLSLSIYLSIYLSISIYIYIYMFYTYVLNA